MNVVTCASVIASNSRIRGRARVEASERWMYDAEVALHAARAADVDAWVAAAYDRLHDAIAEHLAAQASFAA